MYFAEPPRQPSSSFRVRVVKPPLDLEDVVRRCRPLLASQRQAVGRVVIPPNPAERLACLLSRVVRSAAVGKDRFFHLEFEPRDPSGDFLSRKPPGIVWKTVSGILTHPASFGPMVPDLQVLENLKELDRAIHQGRHFVNFQFIVAETQPVGTGWIGREIHQLFRFLKQAERDQDNIYVCYCRRPGRC